MNIDDVLANVDSSGFNLLRPINLTETELIFDQHEVEVVIMGAGRDLVDRLEIIKLIYKSSNSTTLHMKDRNS